MTNISHPISIHPPASERDRAELSQLLEYLDRSSSEVNSGLKSFAQRRLCLIVRAILAGESISVISHHDNLSIESLQQQENLRAESLRSIMAGDGRRRRGI